jgi:hypothetical protein
MTYELVKGDPGLAIKPVRIPVRALGIPKLVIVRKEKA